MKKDEQKQLLTDIMNEDAKDGLYHVGETNKMINMNKEFIPYQQALELKELGFDIPSVSGCSYEDDKLLTQAILYQQALRWFRDKKLIDGSVCRYGEFDGGYSYRWDIVYIYEVYEERHFKKGYKTYEEAELACLNKLIEIVKNK